MEKSEVVDVEKIVEQGKAILTGEVLPKSSEDIKTTLESISSEVEQVRYAEGGKLSSTGQAVLKDLEEILVGGAEVTATIPPETFLHAARAQQKAAEAASGAIEKEKVEGKAEEISEQVVMNMAKLLRMLFTSNEFREAVVDWSSWLKDVIIVQLEEAQMKVERQQKDIYEGIGQVPTEDTKTSQTLPQVKDEQLDKLIGMLEWIQDREEYQSAIGYIFNQFSNLSIILGLEQPESEGSAVEVSSAVDTGKLREAGEEARKAGLDTLKALENWTHKSTEPFKSHVQAISEHLKSDNRLLASLQSLAHFLANCFNEPGFLNDRQWIRQEARDRLDEVRNAIGVGYKKDFRGLADEARDLIRSLDREPRTAHLNESLRKLLEDLFIAGGDEKQQEFRLKTELLGDLGVIVSGLLQRAKYLRVPDLEIHDEDLDFVAHNIILDAAELVPQQFKMTLVTENMIEKQRMKEAEGPGGSGLTEEEKERIFVYRETIPVESHSTFTNVNAASNWQTHLKFEVKGVHGHCRNVHFSVRKRTGFPQLTDEGRADLRVWGPKGMLIKVVLQPEWIKEETIERVVHTKETISKSSSANEPAVITSQQEPVSSTIESTRKFKLNIVKAHCEIDELDLDLHGTRRDWFYTVMGPLVRKRVKSALESAVERNLLTLMD